MLDHPEAYGEMGSKRVPGRSHGTEGHMGHTVNLHRMQLGQRCLSRVHVLRARKPAHAGKSLNTIKHLEVRIKSYEGQLSTKHSSVFSYLT